MACPKDTFPGCHIAATGQNILGFGRGFYQYIMVSLFHKFFGHYGVSSGRDTSPCQYPHRRPRFNLNVLVASCSHRAQNPQSNRVFARCTGYLVRQHCVTVFTGGIHGRRIHQGIEI
ncbi:MAG: hypothetical protein A4E62_03081 [Syntrophorhabdus sp. PtaU1.Bin002]|nr:MAG: hypothetical protein A4E62_03081 [Syntrophorhabdus sp. PtaU1.Bin002]